MVTLEYRWKDEVLNKRSVNILNKPSIWQATLSKDKLG